MSDETQNPSPENKEEEKKENTIPEWRFKEVIKEKNELKSALEKKEQELRQQLEQKNKTPERKTYSRAQLMQAVDSGHLTQVQADELWESQIIEKTRTQVMDEVAQVTEHSRKNDKVSEQIKKYKEAIPDLMDEGETRKKVTTEFNYLVSIGAPDSVETELAALRAAFGPIDALERKRSGRTNRETDQESAGSGNQKGGDKSLFGSLPPRYKAYYENMLAKGFYKSKEDVEKELKRVGPEALKARARRYDANFG